MAKKNTIWQNDISHTSRQAQQVRSLTRIGQILADGARLNQAFSEVLNVLDKDLGLNRGTITLLAPDDNEIRIEATHGLSRQKSRSITYRMGEGVTGRVTQTGKAMIVPKISEEPLFLNRFERWNVTKQELSFICVPIAIGSDVIGTISVDKVFSETASLAEEAQILTVVANMVAIDLRTRREAAIERQLLEDENLRLLHELNGDSRSSGDDHRSGADTQGKSETAVNGSLKERTCLFEREIITDALKRCNGNLTAVARDLRTTARIIRYKVKELEIDYRQYSRKRG
jgi:transcriptional regulator with GAF, ATPase, and Fis domain